MFEAQIESVAQGYAEHRAKILSRSCATISAFLGSIGTLLGGYAVSTENYNVGVAAVACNSISSTIVAVMAVVNLPNRISVHHLSRNQYNNMAGEIQEFLVNNTPDDEQITKFLQIQKDKRLFYNTLQRDVSEKYHIQARASRATSEFRVTMDRTCPSDSSSVNLNLNL